MFGFGCALALLGYSAVYVSVYRLGGDQRSIYDIVMGANGGKPIKASGGQSASIFNPNSPNKTSLPGDSLGLGNAQQPGKVAVGLTRHDANGTWVQDASGHWNRTGP